MLVRDCFSGLVSGALVLLSFCWEKVWLSLLFLFLHSPSEIVPVSAGCSTASTRQNGKDTG